MKTRTNPGLQLLCLALACTSADVAPAEPSSAAIPFAQIGAKATADYQGDALGISATADGVRLRCGFQKLEGRATPEGLWLESTAPGGGGRLRLVAESVSRDQGLVEASPFLWAGFDNLPTQSLEPGRSGASAERRHSPATEFAALSRDAATGRLADSGTVEVADKLVRFIRPGVTEEYSVSVDGVRQDFVIESPPLDPRHPTLVTPRGDLRVELALAGARAEAMAYGAKLKLDGSNRTLAYSRLRATDATGKELKARMEVSPVAAEVTRLKSDREAGNPSAAPKHGEGGKAETSQSLLTSAATEARLAVVVDDADAVYPVRIDPTFSDEDWISMGGLPGANGRVHAAVVDGSGNLYIGGEFTVVGNVLANRVAKWDGSSWSALGSGLDGTDPYTAAFVAGLLVSGSNLYVGGYFTTAGGLVASNVAKWNGSSWSALGSGMNSTVGPLVVLERQWPMSGSDLYAGGLFTTAGGSSAKYVAKWDGSSWSALGSGVNLPVSALAVSGSALYVGGSFTTAGGTTANHVAKWNGSSWSALGSGVASADHQAHVRALAVSGSSLYVGGWFTSAGGIAANNVAKWNGSSWSALGSGVEYPVSALAVSGSALYAGGEFLAAGGSPANCVAKWSGGTWSALGSGVGNTFSFVSALAVSGTNLYVGGQFLTAGGRAASYVAKWNASSWSALGSGLNGTVNAVAVSGTNLYVGGYFTGVGGSAADYVAEWNGSGWSALGSGVHGTDPYRTSFVSALAVSGSDLYVGGDFTTAGGHAANYVAKWNGDSWSALGAGIGSVPYAPKVRTLAALGNDLYVGGEFRTAGGTEATNVAKWDGSGWSALGSGLNDTVYALAVSGTNLYVGGSFTNAGGSAANRIAKWDGSGWSALGSGPNDTVYALAESGTNLYVGGSFTNAGGSAANRIAKWDGSNWSPLGSGLNSDVQALAMSGSDLYVGGWFTTAGGSAANHVGKWDGSNWSALGSGMNDIVYALAASGSDLYAGGAFTTAGGKVSAYVARGNLGPPGGVIQGIGAHGGVVALDCLGLPGTAFTVQRATDVLFTADLTTLLTTNAPAPDGQFRCADSSPPSATAFYRLLKQ